MYLIAGSVSSQLIAERNPGLPGLERRHDSRERLLGVGNLVLEDGGDAVAENLQPPGRVGQQRTGGGVDLKVFAHLDAHGNQFLRKARWSG